MPVDGMRGWPYLTLDMEKETMEESARKIGGEEAMSWLAQEADRARQGAQGEIKGKLELEFYPTEAFRAKFLKDDPLIPRASGFGSGEKGIGTRFVLYLLLYGWYMCNVGMYIRTFQRKNKDGSVVHYIQLAHNQWDPQARCAKAKVAL